MPSSLRRKTRSRSPSRQRTKATGCLLWVLGLIIILTILALLFGGFQKGAKVGMGADAGTALSLSRPWSALLLTAAHPVRHAR